MGACHRVYVESVDVIARMDITYSNLVGVSQAILACFMYALLPLHREWCWCLDLSEYGVSSTSHEAKRWFDEV